MIKITATWGALTLFVSKMTFIHEIKNIVKSVGLGDLSFFTIPNDKIEFNPMKYDNVSFIVNGQMVINLINIVSLISLTTLSYLT